MRNRPDNWSTKRLTKTTWMGLKCVGYGGQQLHFSTWGTMGVGVGYEQVTLRRLVVAAMVKWQIHLDSNPVQTSVVKLKAIEMNFQITAYL